MEIKKKKLINTVLMIVVFVMILLLSWLFLGGKSYSKYKEEMKANSEVKIAKPVFVVDGTSDIKMNGIEDTVYHFDVRNYDEGGINEVEMNYYVEIVNHSEADLEFELTKKGEKLVLNDNKTNLIFLSRLAEQNDSYELKIKYHNKPTVLTDIKGNVQIKVEATQIRKN